MTLKQLKEIVDETIAAEANPEFIEVVAAGAWCRGAEGDEVMEAELVRHGGTAFVLRTHT